jgi:hypothetical protein
MIHPDVEQEVLARYSLQIRQAAFAAYDRIIQAIISGQDARGAISNELINAAISKSTGEFERDFYESFSSALSEVLSRSIGSEQVNNLAVGETTLSNSLYHSLYEVQATTKAALQLHVAGVMQARGLALALYSGYGIEAQEGRDPILSIVGKMGGFRAPGNPSYMAGPWGHLNDEQLLTRVRSVLRTNHPRREFMALHEIMRDPFAKANLERIYKSIQAGGLKTPALRAAYLQRITAWATHDAGRVRDNAVRVAYEEKCRYFANRIGLTELHKSYSEALARDYSDDESIKYVQVRAAPGHVIDVCDIHLQANPTGLGKGIYLKGKCPVPPYHPHCFCKMLNREDVELDKPGQRSSSRDFLNSLDEKEAARVVGSRAKLARVQSGEPIMEVLNEGKPDAYKTKTIKQLIES